MDYGVLLSAFEREAGRDAVARLSQQHRLYACLRAAILGGRIDEGARLPSTRTLADEQGIARNSVLYAYERLAAEGLVHGSRQGTRVARVGLRAGPRGGPRAGLSIPPPADLPAPSRRGAPPVPTDAGMNDPLPFLPGTPALDEFPLGAWRRCVERAWRRATPAQLGYLAPAGNLGLRRAIADYLRASRGARCDAGQVFVTDGTQASLAAATLALADNGDIGWLENPGYGGARQAMQAAGLRPVPIAVDAQGIAPRPRDWLEHPPRLIYVTPSHQYPLGPVMSLERRLAILAGARAAGAWILEDDYDSEFRPPESPLAALQGLVDDAPVVYLGTFSKVMFPGLRLGFMVVPPALAPRLHESATGPTLRGREIDQAALADFIEAGHFTRHLRRMRRLYAQRRAALQAALRRHAGDVLTVSGAGGGMHLTVRLDVPVADTAVSVAGRAEGLVLRPLSRLCLPGTGDAYNGFVLGYGGVPAERMDGLARRIATLVRRTTREGRAA